MYKWYISIVILVTYANYSGCMDNSRRLGLAPDLDFLDPHLELENAAMALFDIERSNGLFEFQENQLFPPQGRQEFFALHYDDSLKQHRVFCSTNRQQLVETLLTYHLLDARCSCAEQQRSCVSKKFPRELEDLIDEYQKQSSLICEEKACNVVVASDTREKLKLKMVLHQALLHGKHPSMQELIQRAHHVIVLDPVELTPKASLFLLDPFIPFSGDEQYVLFCGKSEKAVMQKYFKNRIERDLYNVDYLKTVLVQGTAGQRKVQRDAQQKSLICPTIGCQHKVRMQGVESFDPLLCELFRHFALCHLLSDKNHKDYKIIANRIGTSFLEARDKFRAGQ